MDTLELAADHLLTVERVEHSDVVRILAPDGAVGVTIHVGPDRISLDLSRGSVELRTSGALTVDAERLTLRGRRGLVIESGEDARIDAARRLIATAEDHELEATIGDVGIRANDDVRIDGERIRMNC
ncbi:MAG TPA: hypothetical protein VLL48_13025 [Longimicrobiales bacterium]|nr:hypothetical protein [Longimicrobiales bacterium]